MLNGGLKIGYVPYDQSLTRPGDRRRFVYYARARNLPFEIAVPSKPYDVVVVTAGGDISVWSRYRKAGAIVIFDLVDSYLSVPALETRSMLRGVAKYAVGQNRHLLLNYNRGLEAMCARSDIVLCTTEAQRQTIVPFCKHVFIALDFLAPEVRAVKNNYSVGPVINLVWEGLGINLRFLKQIGPVLKRLHQEYKLALHVLTDLEFGLHLGGRFGRTHATQVTRNIVDNLYLYQWNVELFSTLEAACDLALIPLPLHDPFAAGKCANKLFNFWLMAMPTITSETPAYSSAMRHAGLYMCCRTEQEWLEMLEYYITNEDARRRAGCMGKAYVDEHYSEQCLLAEWDTAFTSVLPEFAKVLNETGQTRTLDSLQRR